MGWSSATEIFDEVVDDLLQLNNDFTGKELLHDSVLNVIKSLYDKLSEKDWDTECESKYWDHIVIGSILGNDFNDEWED